MIATTALIVPLTRPSKRRLIVHSKVIHLYNTTVKPVLSGHSKIDQTNEVKTNSSLMMVESIAECSLRAFCNTFDLH